MTKAIVLNQSDKAAGRIYVKNGRLSYPQLDVAKPFLTSKPRFGATVLFDKTDENKAAVEAAMLSAIMSKITDPKKARDFLLKAKSQAKLSFKDGDLEGKPEYEGMWAIAAYAYEVSPPTLYYPTNAKIPQDQINQVLYAGCRCDFIIQYYPQLTYASVNANLKGVKFRADDARLSQTAPTSSDEFEDIDTENEMPDFGTEEDNAGGLL